MDSQIYGSSDSDELIMFIMFLFMTPVGLGPLSLWTNQYPRSLTDRYVFDQIRHWK